MKWEKKGIIYGPDGSSSWAKNSTLQPTPLLIDDDTIRIFVGFRDDKGVSRVGYVDVDANNPKIIKEVSKEPVLDIGLPGTFDDNGVVPSAVVNNDGKLHLYYAGYQVGYHVRMMIYCGLAISEDGGKSFQRYSKVPVLERCDSELLFRVIHSVVKEKDRWRIYYGGGSYFKIGKKKTLPMYDIRYMESKDGLNFEGVGEVLLYTEGDEYRVGRPYVIKDEEIYKMFFCAGTEDLTYKLAYAESKDGVNWTRDDDKLNLTMSKAGWDSQMMAYPSVINYKDKTYLFYNGNNYGYEGFGYAELIK